jgi:hypothetical protein
MYIIKLPSMEERKGFLDTEEKVREAWESLEKATAEDYKKYDEAKRAVQCAAQTKLLG